MSPRKQKVIVSAVLLTALWLATSILALEAQQVPGREAALNPQGQVHELYRDGQGDLWVSDYFAGEIWRVNPATKAYTVYENLAGASSGRLDGAGRLWWIDFDGNALGRLTPGQSTGTTWSIPANGNILGLTIDNQGRIWTADVYEPDLYRFDPASNQLCQYANPGGGGADYLLAQNGAIWLGDTVLGRILRFDSAANSFKTWDLAQGSYPQGLALDDAGRLWWADNGLGVLSRLNTSDNTVTSYAPPVTNTWPRMVAFDDGKLWYTDDNGTTGALDPAGAQGLTITITPGNSSAQPSCSSLGQGSSLSVTTRGGTITWAAKIYPVAYNANGWRILQLPLGALPWGITASEGAVWFADQGDGLNRAQQLGWFDGDIELPEGFFNYMPAAFAN
jgi:streptogramin lyase